jgi:hypothetical protein
LGTNSKVGTPNYGDGVSGFVDGVSGFVDGGGGVFILNPEDIGVAVPPILPFTQQFTEGSSLQVPQR